MEETWSQYKLKPSNMALYQDHALITYVPTGVTIQTSAAIRKFHLAQKSNNSITELVHNKVSASNKIIEEVDWTISFKHGECAWLLPNLDEHHFVNSTVKIPVVLSAAFENELIASVRIYWDQASVLKQLGVISNRNKWPVVGAEQVDALRSPSGFSTPATPTPTLPVKFNPGTNAFVPGRVFGPVHPDDQVRHAIRKPDPNAPNRNIFSYAPPEPKPLVAHQPNRLGSSFSLTHDEGTPTSVGSSDDDDAIASPPATPPVTNRRVVPESRNIFAPCDDDDLVKKTNAQLKVNARPQPQVSTGTRNILAHH
ncbi:hypothetical protein BC941DRAFT_406265 [Chlamydoabsidia padenii]|nr:hypothetical protein BC941DRAFT_406265 [Chlamydoabsidia padenii]